MDYLAPYTPKDCKKYNLNKELKKQTRKKSEQTPTSTNRYSLNEQKIREQRLKIGKLRKKKVLYCLFFLSADKATRWHIYG
jgi:hypothetical protein